jgi:hypothetical protein
MSTDAFEVPWLQPYPDRLLEDLVAPNAEPEDAVVSKETIELAFIVAIQQLTPGFDQEGFGRMTAVLTRANMQPAVAC